MDRRPCCLRLLNLEPLLPALCANLACTLHGVPSAHAGASVFADFRRNPSKDLPDFDFEWAGADGGEVVGKARDKRP